MRAAVIVGGKVDNIIEAEALDVLDGVELVAAPDAAIGDLWDGVKFTRTPEPDPIPSVPASVTMRQARLALLGVGLLGQAASAIASLDSPYREQAEIEWEFSSEVYRDRPLVAMLGPQLGLTDEQLDQLFITAATL